MGRSLIRPSPATEESGRFLVRSWLRGDADKKQGSLNAVESPFRRKQSTYIFMTVVRATGIR